MRTHTKLCRACQVQCSWVQSHPPAFYSARAREYWMIYIGQRFLNVLWFGSSSTPSPLSFFVSKIDRRQRGDWERETTYWLERRWWGGGGSQIMQRRESLVLYKLFLTLRVSALTLYSLLASRRSSWVKQLIQILRTIKSFYQSIINTSFSISCAFLRTIWS